MARITKTSSDNQDYDVLPTSEKSVLDVESFQSHRDIGDISIHHAYIKCQELALKLLPLDANPREPTGKSNAVAGMKSTLQNAPQDFHKRNNGMTVICDKVDYVENDLGDEGKEKICTITFSAGEGVANGGHTYFSIVTSGLPINPRALVHLELMELPSNLSPEEKKAKIVDIADKRNNNLRLAATSRADFLGFYDIFRRAIFDRNAAIQSRAPNYDSTAIEWHEGDSEAKRYAIKADRMIRLLAALDPMWFYHPIFNEEASDHKNASTSVKGIHEKWYDAVDEIEGKEFNLTHMAPLLNDMLILRDTIGKSLLEDSFNPGFKNSKMYKDWICKSGQIELLTDPLKKGLQYPKTLDVLLIGLFRTNVWLGLEANGNIRYIGWYMDPFTLWYQGKDKLMDKLQAIFKDSRDDPKLFIRASGCYSLDLFLIGTGGSAPLPSIVYDEVTFEKYVAEDTDPTHYLDLTSEPVMKMIDPAIGIPIGSRPFIKLV